MPTRTFSLDEAQTLLPVLESLLRTAIRGKKLIEDVDAEFQDTAHRVFLNGGTLLNVVRLARRKAEREKAGQRVKDAVSEIDATGVQVKDLDIGLLDFPCRVNGEIILADEDAISEIEITTITNQLLNEQQRRKFEAEWELCISLMHYTAGRVRVTFYRRNGHPELSFRFCGDRIASRE